MDITSRHKKPGGFRKLVNSLETTPPERQGKILEAMRKDDPDFVSEVEACIFKFEEFAGLSDLIICEIVGSLNGGDFRSLAFALYKTDENLRQKFIKNMRPPEFAQFREQNEQISQLRAFEQTAGRFRIIEKARELEAKRKIILKRYSPHYADEG